MEGTHGVVASLEEQRVRVEAGACSLDFYDFGNDRWEVRYSAPWPLERETAAAWLAGWNFVDRFAALNLLVKSPQA
jgi:hypothetical protein